MAYEDRFKRQIEQLGRVLGSILAKVFGLKSGNNSGIGIKSVEQIFQSELDVNIDYLLSLPNENFIEILTEEKQFDNTNLEKLADIFYEMIPLYLNDKGKQNLLTEKTLLLYNYLEREDYTLSLERNLKIQDLLKIINQFQ